MYVVIDRPATFGRHNGRVARCSYPVKCAIRVEQGPHPVEARWTDSEARPLLLPISLSVSASSSSISTRLCFGTTVRLDSLLSSASPPPPPPPTEWPCRFPAGHTRRRTSTSRRRVASRLRPLSRSLHKTMASSGKAARVSSVGCGRSRRSSTATASKSAVSSACPKTSGITRAYPAPSLGYNHTLIQCDASIAGISTRARSGCRPT